jgi:calcium-dependent protein kinase
MLVSFCSLLCGSPAFTGKTDEELKINILSKNYTLDHPTLKNVSLEALDLVKKLLRLDPMKRLSASRVLEHPWLKRNPGIICLDLSSLPNIDVYV